MGFSLTGAHVIFFIAAVIAASTVSGIFLAITMDVSSSLSNRGDRLQEQLDTDFEVINDPDNIPTEVVGANTYYKFYVKNIGGDKLITTNTTFQTFIDGDIVAVANYYFADSSISVSDVTTLYILNSEISSGDQTLRLVGPMAVEDEFTFTIP
jgi:flagellar protein FlaG